MDEKMLESKFPSLDLAYDIAVSSFEIASKRFDAMDSRLQLILVFSITVTFASITALSRENYSFSSIWFISSITVFAINVAVGSYARLSGKLLILDPKMFFNKWLHLGHAEFRKDLIFYAGEALEKNCKSIDKKRLLALLCLILFISQMMFLSISLVWLSN